MLTRRDFLELSAMAGAASLLHWTPPALAAMRKAGAGEYDAIIIGAGLGGLCCAAYMARNGLRPLVLESHDIVGGYATSFERPAPGGKSFACEVSLHATAAKSPSAQAIYKELGLTGKLDFVPHADAWNEVYPDFSLSTPVAGLDGLRSLVEARYPSEAQALSRFTQTWKEIMRETRLLGTQGAGGDFSQFPKLYPTLWSIREQSLAQVLDSSGLKDAKARAILTQSCGYYGLPPSKLASFYYLYATGEYLESGGDYLRGTSQRLSDSLADVVRAGGGEVLVDETVTQVVLSQGRASGVKTGSGKSFKAQAVVAAGAVPRLCSELLPQGALPEDYLQRVRGYQPSLSSFCVWLGLSGDVTKLEKRSEITLTPSYDQEAAFRAALDCDVENCQLSVMLYDNLISDFSPSGMSTLCITMLSGFKPWQPFEADYKAGNKDAYYRKKEEVSAKLVSIVEKRLLPGLAKMIVMRESSTPLTNQRFTGNTGGAIYGFDQSTDNSFLRRLDVRTPLPGLYLASAWSNPGGGYGGALEGGKKAFMALSQDLSKQG